MEFKAFPKISRLNKIKMTITQKIHGTNAQIVIAPVTDGHIILNSEIVIVDSETYFVRAGSRNRWIFPGDDNYGFAAFVHENREALVRALGTGQHFGEWAGPGINSGEGLSEKTFCLFDVYRYDNIQLPKNVTTVPVLYEGDLSLEKIEEVMEDLKTNGSVLVPGFMRPEGVVINTMGTRLKKVFKAEETEWTKPSNKKASKVPSVDYSYLLQPVRLEKLLSKDERYLKNYPQSLKDIVKDYVADLEEEGEITGDPDMIKSIKRGASKQIFGFVKSEIDSREGY